MNTEKLIATLNALEIPRGYQMHDAPDFAYCPMCGARYLKG